MDKVDVLIVGAGVVGLAIARSLSRAGREVIVIEANAGIGEETSSRNSEVIHAGIYYKAGSLMARMCVNGKRALYDYCASHGIPHKNCGVFSKPADGSYFHPAGFIMSIIGAVIVLAVMLHFSAPA